MGFGSDPAGRLQSLVSSRGTTTYSYHPTTGRAQSAASPEGAGLAYTFDGALPTATTWTGTVAGMVSRTFDVNFRVVSESVNGSAVSKAYDRDSLLAATGPLSMLRDPLNGLLRGATLGGVSDTYSYNLFGEISSMSASFGATPLFQVDYQRDKLGRIVVKNETIQGLSRSYEDGYDLAGRLWSVRRNGSTIAEYHYDSNGNRIGESSERGILSGSYNARDQILSFAGVTYTHNAAGERTSQTDAAGTRTYEFDSRGTLTSVNLSNGTRIDYVLDAEERRIAKKVDGVLVQGWLYGPGLRVVAELDSSNAVISRFVYGGKVATPEYMVKGGETYRLITDHLGSVRLVVNAATGDVAQRIDYDDWGNILQDTNPGFQPFGFTGREHDIETGLVYMRARYYEPNTGRFISEDPIGFVGGDVNLFGYVGGNPINWIDPWGLAADLNLFDSRNQWRETRSGTLSRDWQAGQNLTSKSDEYRVVGHGERPLSGHPVATIGGLDVKKLAERIRKDKNWRRRPINLLACDTSSSSAQIEAFAQKLADELQVNVTGHGDVWIHEDGRPPIVPMNGTIPFSPRTMGPLRQRQ